MGSRLNAGTYLRNYGGEQWRKTFAINLQPLSIHSMNKSTHTHKHHTYIHTTYALNIPHTYRNTTYTLSAPLMYVYNTTYTNM